MILKAFRKYGLSGMLMTVVILIIILFPDKTQKQEFFDLYVLFKTKHTCVITVVFLFLIAFFVFNVERNYYIKRLRIKDDEISRMANEKTILQERLSNKALHKSNFKSKK